MRAGFALVLFAFVGSCAAPRAATQVFLEVDADEIVRGRATDLRLDVFGGLAAAGTPQFPTELRGRLSLEVAAGAAWPRTLTLAPEGRDASRTYRVVATATDRTGATVAIARVISGYVRGEARSLRMYLSASCGPSECGDTETCDAALGTCVDAVVPAEELPSRDAGAADTAQRDAGNERPDAGIDAAMDAALPRDAGLDAAGIDARFDVPASHDGGADAAALDASADAAWDGGADARLPVDSGIDGGRDAPLDAAPDPGALLRINEIDSVAEFSDDDFVEIRNTSTSDVFATGLVVEIVEMMTCTVVASVPLFGGLSGGAMLRVSASGMPDASPGVVLRRVGAAGPVFDTASFGSVPFAGECRVAGTLIPFTARLVDPGASSSIQRCPDGTGTWALGAPPTSGSPNVCP